MDFGHRTTSDAATFEPIKYPSPSASLDVVNVCIISILKDVETIFIEVQIP